MIKSENLKKFTFALLLLGLGYLFVVSGLAISEYRTEWRIAHTVGYHTMTMSPWLEAGLFVGMIISTAGAIVSVAGITKQFLD